MLKTEKCRSGEPSTAIRATGRQKLARMGGCQGSIKSKTSKLIKKYDYKLQKKNNITNRGSSFPSISYIEGKGFLFSEAGVCRVSTITAFGWTIATWQSLCRASGRTSGGAWGWGVGQRNYHSFWLAMVSATLMLGLGWCPKCVVFFFVFVNFVLWKKLLLVCICGGQCLDFLTADSFSLTQADWNLSKFVLEVYLPLAPWILNTQEHTEDQLS